MAEAKLTDRQKLRLVMPWVGRRFPSGKVSCQAECPFCGRWLVTAFHRSDCIMYRCPKRSKDDDN